MTGVTTACEHPDSKLRVVRGYENAVWQLRCTCGQLWHCEFLRNTATVKT